MKKLLMILMISTFISVCCDNVYAHKVDYMYSYEKLNSYKEEKLIDQLNQKLTQSLDQYERASLYNMIGCYYNSISKYDKAKEYFEKSIATFKNINDENGVVYVYKNIMKVDSTLKDYDDYLMRFLEISDIINNTEITKEKEYSFLAELSLVVGNYDEAKKYILKAISYDHNKDKYWDFHILGDIYIQNEEYKKALITYKKANEYYDEYEKYYIGNKNSSIIKLCESTNIAPYKITEIYIKLNEIEKAEKNLKDTLKNVNDFEKNMYEYAMIYSSMGQIQEKKGEFYSSLESRKKAQNIYKKLGIIESEKKILYEIIKLSNYLNPNELMSYYQRFVDITNENDYKVVSLRKKIMYLFEEKKIQEKNEKVVLLEKEKKMQNEIIRKSKIEIFLCVVLITLLNVFIYREIKRVRKLNKLLITDHLTQINTKAYMIHNMQKFSFEDNICDKYVAMIDIDNFKKLNDTQGHLFGDEVLATVGNLLKKSISEGELVGRYGGEEFIMVLCRDDIEEVIIVLDKIRDDIQNINWLGRDDVSVTVSMGVIKLDKDYNLSIDEADKLLYEAKNDGKNKVCWRGGE